MAKITQFGVKFGDNDFYNTYRVMLPIVAENLYTDKYVEVTKEHLAKVISAASYGFYIAAQNQFQYNLDQSADYMIRYFQVKPEQIFINDELIEYIAKNSKNCNSELFCVTVPDDTYYPCKPDFWSV